MGKILDKNIIITPMDDLSKYSSRQKIKFTCDECGKEYIKSIEAYLHYPLCKECTMKHMYTKVKETCLSKYGVENPFQVDEYKIKSSQTKLDRYNDANYTNRDKAKETINHKYGVDYYVCTDAFKEKSKITKKDKYGNANFVNCEKSKKTKLDKYGDQNYNNCEQIKITMLNKYGVPSYMQTEEFKEKTSMTMLNKYGVDNFRKSFEYKEKYEKTCMKKYGVRHYSQTSMYAKKTHFSYDFFGEHFHSSWELAVWIYYKDMGVNIQRTPTSFEYTYNGEVHKYFPDFLIDNVLYEVKGNHLIDEDGEWINPYNEEKNELYATKKRCAEANGVKLLDCSVMLNYVYLTYGKDYLKQFKMIK